MSHRKSNQPSDDKSKVTARLIQRGIFKIMISAKQASFLQVEMFLNDRNEITILYSGGCRDTEMTNKTN